MSKARPEEIAIEADSTYLEGTDGTWPDKTDTSEVRFYYVEPNEYYPFGSFGVKWETDRHITPGRERGDQYGAVLRLPPRVWDAFLKEIGRK